MLEIKTVAVIGAGPSGRSIAHTAALAGYRTVLVDILPPNLRQAESEMRDRVEQARELGRLSSQAAREALKRLEFASTVADAAREADLVIEAVPDEMESKLEIFTLLDKICRPQTILATTTQALSIGEIAGITFRQAKIVGMRFETGLGSGQARGLRIVRARSTNDETVGGCFQAGCRMGLDVTVTSETLPDAV